VRAQISAANPPLRYLALLPASISKINKNYINPIIKSPQSTDEREKEGSPSFKRSIQRGSASLKALIFLI